VKANPSDKYKRTKQLGLLSVIPAILAVAPLIGFFMGSWIDRRFGTDPVFKLIFLALGFAAGVRETITLIKRAQESENESNH
jgi:ATP synthase protein I